MLTIENMPGEITSGEQFKACGKTISRGEELHYTMITDELIFQDDEGHPEASMVMYAYFLDGCSTERPVMFVIAGGPGAGSGLLSIGMYGAKIYDFAGEQYVRSKAPYLCKDNDDWILDSCDIVLIDPVGAGLGRLLNPAAGHKYFGHEQDCYALSRAIAFWLEKYGRMNSPKFFNGVSYGGQRCCLLPRYLFGGLSMPGGETLGITFNGIIQMGDACLVDTNAEQNVDKSRPEQLIPDICFQTAGYAAANWYHHPEGKTEQMTFVDEAYRFAFGPLKNVLGRPESADGERADIAQKLSYYIGIAPETILSRNFCIDMLSFCHSLALEKEGKALGLYDTRYTIAAGAFATPTFDMISDDAMMASAWSAAGALTSYLNKNFYNIHFEDGRVANCQNFNVYRAWDWHIQEHTRPIDWQIFNMRHHRDMRLMIVSGIHDACWNYGYSRYTYEKMGLPKDRTTFRAYPAGHSMYLDEKSRHMMADDFRTFIKESI